MIFVILNHPNEGVVAPLMDKKGEQVAIFDSVQRAADAIKTNTLGAIYGGRVFDTDQPVLEI